MIFSGCRLKSSALCPRENKVVIIVQRITRCVVGYRGIVVFRELVAPVAVAVGVRLGALYAAERAGSIGIGLFARYVAGGIVGLVF